MKNIRVIDDTIYFYGRSAEFEFQGELDGVLVRGTMLLTKNAKGEFRGLGSAKECLDDQTVERLKSLPDYGEALAELENICGAYIEAFDAAEHAAEYKRLSETPQDYREIISRRERMSYGRE